MASWVSLLRICYTFSPSPRISSSCGCRRLHNKNHGRRLHLPLNPRNVQSETIRTLTLCVRVTVPKATTALSKTASISQRILQLSLALLCRSTLKDSAAIPILFLCRLHRSQPLVPRQDLPLLHRLRLLMLLCSLEAKLTSFATSGLL